MHWPESFSLNMETSWRFMTRFTAIFCWILAVPGMAAMLLLTGMVHQLGFISQLQGYDFVVSSLWWIIAGSGFFAGLLTTNHIVSDERARVFAGQILPKLKIIYRDGIPPWFQKGPDAGIRTHRISVINTSREVVQNVRVEMLWIDPQPTDQRLVPCPLHFRHDNVQPFADSKDLFPSSDSNYGDALFIDVLWSWSGAGELIYGSGKGADKVGIWSTVQGVPQELIVRSYTLAIKVSSRNGGDPVIVTCRFNPEEEMPRQFTVSL